MTSAPLPARAAVLRRIADLIGPADRPILVGVDGVDGAGKTWMADEVAAALAERDPALPIVRATVDRFHHEQAHRHALGRTAETVWNRSFDYRAMRRELLDPWLRGPGSTYRASWRDVASDALLDAPQERVPARGVLLVDGVFIQRPELVDVWDVTIFLDVPLAVSTARMAERDGTPVDPDDPAQRRYAGAQRHYLTACDPAGIADIVVDNTDLGRPVLTHPVDAVPSGWRADGGWWIRSVRVPAGDAAASAAVDRAAPPH